MSYYFNADGSLQFTSGSGTTRVSQPLSSNSSSSLAANAVSCVSKAAGAPGKFSDAMKTAAQAASGKITSNQKAAAFNNTPQAKLISQMEAIVKQLENSTPTVSDSSFGVSAVGGFGDDDDIDTTDDLSALKNFQAAQESYFKVGKSSASRTSSGSYSRTSSNSSSSSSSSSASRDYYVNKNLFSQAMSSSNL